MATILQGLSQFVFNGETVALAGAAWLPNVRAIYKVNDTRDGWETFKPGFIFQSFNLLERDKFYYVDSLNTFDLPDAQTIPCDTSEGVIPEGLSQFLYAGPDLNLAGLDVVSVHHLTPGGWNSYKPGRAFQSLSTLQAGKFYLIQTLTALALAGAQLTGCAATFASEKIDGSKYVRYTDLRGAIAPGGEENPKTAPDMVLFRQLYDAFINHNHDTRYHTKAEIALLLSGIDEVQEYLTFGAFPPTGETATLYFDAQYGVGYRWTGTQYMPISSPGVDLTPYLKIADAEATYLKKTDAANTYQPKGNYLTRAAADPLYQPQGSYVKTISIPGGLSFTPNLAGNITLLLDGYFDAWMKARPGYDVTKNNQVVTHDTNGVILWATGGTTTNPVQGDFSPADFTNDFYLTTI